MDELTLPDSPAVRNALEVCRRFSPPALVNHCLRSYLFAAAYGRAHGIGFDDELLCVSSMLHDLGLSAEFDNHTLPFETAGGHLAWAFAAGAGWPAERRDRAALAVVDHMRDGVNPAADPEGHLLALATSLDISGARPQDWPDPFVRAVVARHPRLDLGARFLACFADQAARKPSCTAAASVRSGLAGRLAANPLDQL